MESSMLVYDVWIIGSVGLLGFVDKGGCTEIDLPERELDHIRGMCLIPEKKPPTNVFFGFGWWSWSRSIELTLNESSPYDRSGKISPGICSPCSSSEGTKDAGTTSSSNSVV